MLFCEMIIFWRNTRCIQRLSSFSIPNDQLPAVCCVIMLLTKNQLKTTKERMCFLEMRHIAELFEMSQHT